jgi:hypothetical protein
MTKSEKKELVLHGSQAFAAFVSPASFSDCKVTARPEDQSPAYKNASLERAAFADRILSADFVS